MADGVAGPAAEEDLPRDRRRRADPRGCRAPRARARRSRRVARGRSGAPIALEQTAQRHVLAERDTTHLLVAGDRGRRRRRRDLRVVEVVSPAPSITPTVSGGAQAPRRARRGRRLRGCRRHGPSTCTTFSGHTTRSTGGLHVVGRVEVALEDDARIGVARRGCLAGRRPARARCCMRTDVVAVGARRLRTRPRAAIAAAPTATAVHARSHAAEMVTPMITTSMTSSGEPPTPDDERDRRDRLADRERRERHAAERP